MRVAVIGGGINGFCCAVQILEYFQRVKNEKIEVTVISDEFCPNTTGDGSAGLWGPYLLGATSEEKVYKWSKSTHDFLQQLWLSEDAGEAGVCLIPEIRVNTNESDGDFWKDIVYGFTTLSQEQLNEYNTLQNKNFKYGVHFLTYTSEPIKLLPYLMKRFQANGGKTIRRKVDNLVHFISNNQYDVFINCTGLGSRNLIGDNQVYPVRGQVSRVKANWMFSTFMDDSDIGNYIIPNTESVVLGGTHQVGDFSTEVSESDKKFIVKGCREIVPALYKATHLFDWVGLRPGKEILRLETETIGNKLVVHNYGHGGAGVTLAWGCAEEVLELLQSEKSQRNYVLKSKL